MRQRSVEIFPMVHCSIDNFYEPEKVIEETVEAWIPYAMCLSKPGDITLFGNPRTRENQELNVRLTRCKDRLTCKNETEINEFIDKNG